MYSISGTNHSSRRKLQCSRLFMVLACVCGLSTSAFAEKPGWQKHVVYEGEYCTTAVAADYTGDGVVDVMADTGSGITRLLAGPNWKEVVIDDVLIVLVVGLTKHRLLSLSSKTAIKEY